MLKRRMESESSSNLYNLNHFLDINQTCFGCEFGEVRFLLTEPLLFSSVFSSLQLIFFAVITLVEAQATKQSALLQ